MTWPVSVWKERPSFKTETIFYEVGREEARINLIKLGLDDSQMKRLFYSKYVFYKDRYLSNLMVFFDINNYFFKLHPREDAATVGYRIKFPFWSVIFFVPGLMVAVKKNKLILWSIVGAGLLLSFLRNFDGFDMLVYIQFSLILFWGMKLIVYKIGK